MTLVGSHYIVYVIQCMSVHWPRWQWNTIYIMALASNLYDTRLKDDPLKWWAPVGMLKYPLLGDCARKYLCIPASSATSEREFKVAKNIDKPRPNLNHSNLEMLIFLKYNLRAFAYEDVEDINLPLNWTAPNPSLVKAARVTQPQPPSPRSSQQGTSSDEDDSTNEDSASSDD